MANFFMANETDLSWNTKPGSVQINGFATGINVQNSKVNKILSCYPNPFTDQLTIEYFVEIEGVVQIHVYDMYGKMVAEITDGNHVPETYKYQWNGLDLNGNRITNGTYFVRILNGDNVQTEKVQLVR